MTPAQTALAQTYRDLAAQCRAMAEHTRRPGALVRRAESLDATAAEIERPNKPPL
jgi:hypothetical protein